MEKVENASKLRLEALGKTILPLRILEQSYRI